MFLENKFEFLKGEIERAKEEYERRIEEIDREVDEIFRNLEKSGKKITNRILLNQILDDYIQKKLGKGEMEILKEIDISAKKKERIVFARYGKFNVLLRIIYKGENNFQILNCELYVV
ncbi:hypothetical protein Ferp_1766 [Ferroglobus placidus DSM 10642]|uniref:Uncharacterized protein n=2 Tax=Ferroglobus placidus TaxID=54261 RepID=D3RZJ6_FERPA|nr:hypothetical protein Ferp_1766 [Ferroglobus placidus DSM 10642]